MSEPSSQQVIAFFLGKLGPLPEEVKERIAKKITIQTFPKGSIIQKEGEVAQNLYFIVRGLLRLYYMKDANEFTRQFFFENGFAFDLASCMSGEPTRIFIDAVEDTQVLKIPYVELDRIKHLKEAVLSGSYIKVVERMASIFLDSPEEKYRQLVDSRPKVMQRIPQYMIASYIGVTPEGLSRIKKRMAKKDRS